MMSTHDGTGVILVVDSVMLDYRTGRSVAVSNVYTAGPRHLIFSLSLPQVITMSVTISYFLLLLLLSVTSSFWLLYIDHLGVT